MDADERDLHGMCDGGDISERLTSATGSICSKALLVVRLDLIRRLHESARCWPLCFFVVLDTVTRALVDFGVRAEDLRSGLPPPVATHATRKLDLKREQKMPTVDVFGRYGAAATRPRWLQALPPRCFNLLRRVRDVVRWAVRALKDRAKTSSSLS